MKNVKISADLHQKIKEISIKDGITMDAVFRKILANVHKVQNANVHDGNTLPERKVHSAQNGVLGGNSFPEPNAIGVLNSVLSGKTLPELKAHKVQNVTAAPKNQEKNNVKEIKKMSDKEEMQRAAREALREERNQDREKANQKQVLEGLKNSIQDLKGNLQGLERKFCTPDGKTCFLTEAGLASHLAMLKQEFEAHISEKISQVAKRARPTLSPINPEVRGTMSESDSANRDYAVKQVLARENVSPLDLWRYLKDNPEEYASVRRHFFNDVSPEELLDKCNLGDPEACKKLFEASKLVVLKENQKSKKWEAVFNPEAEEQKPELGLFGLPRK